MTRWMMLCIAAFSLIASSRISVEAPPPASLEPDASSRACLTCHPEARNILSGPMAMRSGERAFAHRAFGFEEGERFFAESCAGCHVTSCSDCHGNETHPSSRPPNEACLRCHRGHSAGWEYEGKAPREDHARYQRGATSQGEPFLRMLPDIHFERGLVCADCHPMDSLHTGGRAKGCLDCHPSPSLEVPEHAITAHMEGMQCVACHAAWAAQEYGTFLIRTATAEQEEAFAPLRTWGPYQKSAHLRRQDPPPLGVDLSGRIAPIRPRLILLMSDSARGLENHLVAAEWRAFMPHTVRRGSVTCGGCHDNGRRFLLESDKERIYLPDADGIGLKSYWNREGQSVVNGAFISSERHARMNTKTPEYARQVVNHWKIILNRAAPHSAR